MLSTQQIQKSLLALLLFSSIACTNKENVSSENVSTQNSEQVAVSGGQENVKDDISQKNVVQIAAGSADHTTLVAAVKAADLVTALSNAGPFTVFAPTNKAFDELPAGTVDNLLKTENKSTLQDILEYHVSVGVFKAENLKDGQSIGQVNGGNVHIAMKDGKPTINGANIVASISASNGVIHVIDKVLLPSD